ncbi:Glyoxalase/Bleomycin resistance protein/Dihydroxybiphenyl dioxygenase [Zopfochytrium polystomum]|nr:Glyoxalase/Bleomycin resistance protein/Dihydroxybiphenyl dioxygenase [Zopfochytrium polystomum]
MSAPQPPPPSQLPPSSWPRSPRYSDRLPAVRFRVARPTRDLEALRRFYVDALGLPVVSTFADAVFTGLILGVPDERYQLEFIVDSRHPDMETRAPTQDNLLVFYLDSVAAVDSVARRLVDAGGKLVEPVNDWWKVDGLTVEDPEGWRVVLFADYDRVKTHGDAPHTGAQQPNL